MENWVCDLYSAYNKIFKKNFFFNFRNKMAAVTQIKDSFSRRLAAELSYIFLEQKIKFFS